LSGLLEKKKTTTRKAKAKAKAKKRPTLKHDQLTPPQRGDKSGADIGQLRDVPVQTSADAAAAWRQADSYGVYLHSEMPNIGATVDGAIAVREQSQERAIGAQERALRRSKRIAQRPPRVARTPSRDAPTLVLCDERRVRRSARARVLYVSAARAEGGSATSQASAIDRCVRDALSGLADLDPVGSLSARHYRVENIDFGSRAPRASDGDGADAAALEVGALAPGVAPLFPRARRGSHCDEGVASLRIRARARPFGSEAHHVVVLELLEGDVAQFERLAAHVAASLAGAFDVALRPSGAAQRRLGC
jgi:hypothetical protein